MGISYKKVKEIALSQGIKSDNAICKKCCIPNGTFNDWKNGNTKTLSEQNITKLANGLNVPVGKLFDDEFNNGAELPKEDIDLMEMLNDLKERPECRIMLSTMRSAKAEDILQTAMELERRKNGGYSNQNS